MPQELRPWVKWLTLITGHLGQLGRAGLFLLVSVLMWRALDGSESPDPNEKEKNTIGRAFTQLQARPLPTPWHCMVQPRLCFVGQLRMAATCVVVGKPAHRRDHLRG
jgi:hypothetical protein